MRAGALRQFVLAVEVSFTSGASPAVSVRVRMKRGHRRRMKFVSRPNSGLVPTSRSSIEVEKGWMAPISPAPVPHDEIPVLELLVDRVLDEFIVAAVFASELKAFDQCLYCIASRRKQPPRFRPMRRLCEQPDSLITPLLLVCYPFLYLDFGQYVAFT